MPKNNKLNDLLDKGAIKRGKGFTLSTEEPQQESAQVHISTDAEVQESTSALVHKSKDTEGQNNTSVPMHKSTNALVHKETEDTRPSKGYKLRTDVADACKLFAVLHKRKLYEVMEEALIEYLQKHGVDIHW